jgi:serine/threonine-protein kinase SRPK3
MDENFSKLDLSKKIGSGAFSNVYISDYKKSSDVDNMIVAVKVGTEKTNYKYARNEIRILKKLKNSNYNINYIDHKLNKKENYIIFEYLGNELYKLIKIYKKNGNYIPLDVIKNITRQILKGLVELRKKNILHNDLKPENILFKKPLDKIFLVENKNDILCKIYKSYNKINNYYNYSAFKNIFRKYSEVIKELLLLKMEVKISDFGNSVSKKTTIKNVKWYRSTIPTRHYIAPEILIKSPYWIESDMWSFGCVIYELLTLDVLFQPEKDNTISTNSYHLALIIKTFGSIPEEVLKYGKKTNKYFHNYLHKFNYLIGKKEPLNKKLKSYGYSKKDSLEIMEFLLPMFEFDISKRITPQECLKSKWLNIHS